MLEDLGMFLMLRRLGCEFEGRNHADFSGRCKLWGCAKGIRGQKPYYGLQAEAFYEVRRNNTHLNCAYGPCSTFVRNPLQGLSIYYIGTWGEVRHHRANKLRQHFKQTTLSYPKLNPKPS